MTWARMVVRVGSGSRPSGPCCRHTVPIDAQARRLTHEGLNAPSPKAIERCGD